MFYISNIIGDFILSSSVYIFIREGAKGTARVTFVTTWASVRKTHRLYRILLGTLVGGRPCYPPPQRRWRSL